MSKSFRSFLFVFAAFVLILHLFNNSNAQNIEATITLVNKTSGVIQVKGKFLWGKHDARSRNLSFIRDYAGIHDLGERFSDVFLEADDGTPVKFRRLMAGEYLAERDFTYWSYTMNVTPLKDQTAVAHLSWLTADGGILFFFDLLPHTSESSGVSLSMYAEMNGRLIGPVLEKDRMFQDRNKTVVFLDSSNCRIKSTLSGKTNLILGIDDEWKFDDDAAQTTASEVFKQYQNLFGSFPSLSATINIKRFPMPIAVGNYEADTRGSNITIISSDMAFESESVQRLHEILRHEMFHLWIPNGVNLSGNYDWFYEGFALYQSLKTGVALNRIRFDDYLDTLSRAYDIDRKQMQKLSLIDVSKYRWTGDNNTRVYVRGMLVAFLCDLALLEKSKGKRSVTDILRKLYEKHRPPSAETDGNAAVLALLRSHTELTPIIDRNITGAESIDWVGPIKAAGLEVDPTAQTTNLKVAAKPTGRQKDLLDKLGYNNWRKLSSK